MLCGLFWLVSQSMALEEPRGPAQAAYDDLLELRFDRPFPVPEEGLVLELAGARWILEEGTVWLQEPIAGETRTGIAFLGRGRFDLEVPDQTELDQLRRYARKEAMESVDAEFDRLYLRSAAPEVTSRLRRIADEARGASTVASRELPGWVRERRNRWILHAHQDADARILGALATFGERYLRADMRFQEFDWMTFSFDARQREELELLKPTRHNQSIFKPFFLESWLQLDRPEDRSESGRPGLRRGGFSRIEHLDLAVDLTRLGENPAIGFGDSHPIEAAVRGTATFESKWDGLGAVVVRLDPRATDIAVRSRAPDGSSTELQVLRFARGELVGYLEDGWGNREFVVVLDAPLAAGERVDLEFRYDLELVNFAPGLSWHPTSADSEIDPFTAALEFTTRDYYDVRATGRRVASEDRGRTRWSRWQVDDPARIVGFTFARFPHAERFEWPGLRPLTIFATTGGYLSAVRIANLGRFFEGNLRCLTERLGPPPSEELTVSLIAAGHSQAFPGFIQVTEELAKKGRLGIAVHGTKELLAAHELAHQWWGHRVRPDSERDVWLSESLAEYTAAQCVRDTVDDGERVFDDIVEAFTHEIHGDTTRGFNAFSRLGLTILGSYERDRLPPISHGIRGALSNNPWGNLTTLYRKGALILHMVDELLRVETGDAKAFDRLLVDLVSGEVGSRLRTEDLEAEIQRRSELDWKRLFDQWVRHAEVPVWRTAMELDGARLTVRVAQSGVPPEFRSWVPVRTELVDGTVDERLVLVQGAETRIEIEYPSAVRQVEWNTNGAVPARVRGRSTLRR